MMCRLCVRRFESISERNARAGRREKVISRKHVRGFWGERKKVWDG